jgi:hypothetical protein
MSGDTKKKILRTVDNLLSKIYFTPAKAGSFGSLEGLARASKINRNVVKHFLARSKTYSLHKPVRLRFKRNKMTALALHETHQIDLIDLSKYRKSNDNKRFVLCVIDILSRYLWAQPIHSKRPKDVIDGFKTIIKRGKYTYPATYASDAGTEFKNKYFYNFIAKFNARHYILYGDNKAAIVERVQRTILTRLMKYLHHNKTYRYIEALQDLVTAYNNSYHRTIRMTPSQANNKRNESKLIEMQNDSESKLKAKLKVGDLVRLAIKKELFTKGYKQTYTDEIFKIVKVNTWQYKPMYHVADMNDEIIKGRFYEDQLQKVVSN